MKTYIKASVLSLAMCALCACAGNQQNQGASNGFSVQSAPEALNAVESNPEVADNYACGNQGVLICHLPPGNPANKQSLCIGAPAVAHHLQEHKRDGLSDYLGACADDSSGGDSSGSSSGGTSDNGGSTGGTTDGGSSGGTTGGIVDCTLPGSDTNILCM